MPAQNQSFESSDDLKARTLGFTEQNWCKAAAGGTGITVLALRLCEKPDISHLENALHKLQNSHPILKAKLDKNATTFSITIPSRSNLRIKTTGQSMPDLQAALEREFNTNSWSDAACFPADVMFVTTYELPSPEWAVVIRLHTVACDRTTALSLLNELMELIGDNKKGNMERKGEVSLGIEEIVPRGKGKKSLWAHGLDTLGYSVSSLRLTNLKFKDPKWPRSSEVLRFKLTKKETDVIINGCKTRGIKLCGVLVAAGLMAANSSKRHPSSSKKYGVVTLIDCRSLLEPPLSPQNFGFYHSAILNIHQVKGSETLWDMASKSYMAFADSKNTNKHFSDMSDLNFLMAKAIDNPSLTPSASLRTSVISVFEDPVFDNSTKMQREIGVDDYIGCSSVHGVGPSIAIFDTIRDGELDCTCVYPSPLHSREQMQEFVDDMKIVLARGI